MSFMLEFIKFVKTPSIKKSVYSSRLNIIFLFGIYILGVIFLGILASIICKLFGIDHSTAKLPIKQVLIGIFLAPIYEEIIFRLLFRINIKNFIIFFITVLLLTIISYLNHKNIAFLVLLSILLLSLVIWFTIDNTKIAVFNKVYFSYIFYISTFLFGLSHLYNFSGNTYTIIIFSILLVSPQLFLGLILGYIRMQFGIVYSIMFHMLINLSLIFSLLQK